MTERLFVRILMAMVLCTSLVAFAIAPIPRDESGSPDLPAPALGQTALYRMELGLLVFYGDLLLITPALLGLLHGRLPIEISTRGARFAEGSEWSADLDEATITELEATIRDLARGLTDAQIDIQQLSERTNRDSRQQEVDSKDD